MIKTRKFISPGNIEGKLLSKKNKLLSLVRKFPHISRQKCAVRMGLSTFNVAKLVSQLVKSGLVLESKPSFLTKRPKGKPSTPLCLNPNYDYFAGVDIEAFSWRFIILDFAGNTVFSIEMPFYPCKSREEYVNLLKKCLEEAIRKSGSLWEKVSVLGVGSPGNLDHASGVIIKYEILPHFSMIPLLDIYREISQKQVHVTKNINCLAIHDLWKRPASESLIVLHVAVRSGISVSLNARGTVFMGGHGRAGELGFFFTSDDGRSLQDICSLSALKKNLPNIPEDFWRGYEETVSRQLKRKNVREPLSHAMKILSMALVSAVALLDPDEVIIYSPLFSEENLLWKNFKDEFLACQSARDTYHVHLIRAEAAKFNAATGASLMAIEKIYPT
jgi:predicted NBD/HSP70 family sugar kinase